MYEWGRSGPGDAGKDKRIILYSYLHAVETKYKQNKNKTKTTHFISLFYTVVCTSHLWVSFFFIHLRERERRGCEAQRE